MKIHKECLIELAVSKDATRHAITEPYLDITDGVGTMIATDGRIMAIVPVDLGEHDVAGYVAVAGIKQARKLAKKGMPDFAVNGAIALSDGSTLPRDGQAKDGTFPKWRQVVPDYTGKITCKIGLNAALLANLAAALGTDGVSIEFTMDSTTGKANNEGGFLVRPISTGKYERTTMANPAAHGIIMPVRCE